MGGLPTLNCQLTEELAGGSYPPWLTGHQQNQQGLLLLLLATVHPDLLPTTP